MTNTSIKILFPPTLQDPFCVVWKDGGVPSAPGHRGGDGSMLPMCYAAKECALSLAVRECSDLGQVNAGSAEHGLIHRLDTDARGLLLIAATDAAYNALIAAQKRGLFKKTYRAQVERIPDNATILGGFPRLPLDACRLPLTLTSRFRAWGPGRKEVRPVTEYSGMKAQKSATKRVYQTAVQSISSFDNFSGNTAICSITAGFRHQVRCHLAWLGFPVAGDRLYNRKESAAPLQFECIALSFPHPLTGEIITIDNNGIVI